MARHTRTNQERPPKECNIGQLVIRLKETEKRIDECRAKIALMEDLTAGNRPYRHRLEDQQAKLRGLEQHHSICQRWLDRRRRDKAEGGQP